MARRARKRILYDGCYAHIMSRTSEKQFIFKDDEDFEIFKNYLLQKKKEHGFKMHHYCLMNTHFHLLVKIGSLESFSKGLQTLKWKYTHWHNRKYERSGPVWKERFKSMLVENERYLYACGMYIEHNPVEAGMVKRAEDWGQSSSQHYFLGKEDDLIDRYECRVLPKGIDCKDKKYFTEGYVIGSELFKIYQEEEPTNQ